MNMYILFHDIVDIYRSPGKYTSTLNLEVYPTVITFYVNCHRLV
jgi:hypothetical protein